MIHKTITILTTLLFLLALLTPVYAAENSARLMVTDCSVSEGGLSAGKEATLYITIKNQSVSADADYCKLTFSEASGDILPVGTGTQYVDCIKAHDTYIWELPVSVASNAADGTHTVEVRIAFTQPDGSSDSAEDSLRVQVEQAVDLEVGSVGVPGEVVSGDMANFSFTALNTGKSTLYGVTMTVTVDGAGTVGKDSLGTLSAGSSGTGSISFSTDDFIVSARAGTVTFTAETANGEEVTASERYYFTIVSEEEGDAEAMDESDRSQPRLMVASYIIQDEALSPGAEKKVSVTLVNTHADKDVYNLKLSFNSESDGITCRGMGTQYLEKLEAGESYVWEIYLTAAHTAQSGLHTATVQVEYEDSEGSAYSASDTLRLPVRQTVLLVWDNLTFPEKAVMGDTVTLSLTLQNMGGAAVSNALVTFEIEGLRGSGSILVGDIEAGASHTVTANFNVVSETPGKIEGVAKLHFQDDFGDNHAEDISFATEIIEKPLEPTEEEQKVEEQTQSGIRFWWAFALGGLVLGAGAAAAIAFSIVSGKARREDEERL